MRIRQEARPVRRPLGRLVLSATLILATALTASGSLARSPGARRSVSEKTESIYEPGHDRVMGRAMGATLELPR
jgi:hypothetical protein